MTEPAVQTKTNSLGSFAFNALTPESYAVRVEKQGFEVRELADVTLAPSTETALNIVLTAAGPSVPSTRVASELPPQLQTSDAEVSSTVTPEQLEQLPYLDQNPLALIPTQAGVVAAGGAPTVIDGLRTSYSNVTLDGINIQDNTVRWNGLQYVANNLRLTQVSQFTLLSSNQFSIYGNGATQAAFVSPSGTNQVHGSILYLNQNNASNAGSWFQNGQGLKEAAKENEGGFTLAGPLVKEKLFGYVAYEFDRGRDSLGERVFELTRLLDITGQTNNLFYYSSPALINLLTADLEAQGYQPNAAISGVLGRIPAPNAANGFLGFAAPVFEHAETAQTNLDNVTGRLDYVHSQRNTFVVSYLWSRVDTDRDLSLFGGTPAYTQRSNPTLVSGSWRFVPSARLTNELRLGLNIAPVDFINREQTEPYVFNLGPFQPLNPVYSSGQDQGRRLGTYDFQDNASYVAGRHNLQFGFQAQLLRIPLYLFGGVPVISMGTGQGTFNDALNVLYGYYSAIAENFFSANQTGQFGSVPDHNNMSLDNYAGYLQDKWRVSRQLMVTLGLRYDYYTPFRGAPGLFYSPQLAGGSLWNTFAAATPVFNPKGSGFYQPDSTTFAPNAGVAFDPFASGRTVFRAGYGINYVNDDFIDTFQSLLSLNSDYLGYSQTSSGVLSSTTLQNLGTLIPYPTGGTGLQSPSHIFGVIDPGLRTPYVEQWSAGVQQEIARFVLDLRYVGNHAAKMLRPDEFTSGPNPNTIIFVTNSSGSTYNALQFNVSRHLGSTLQFQANYTFSKVLTDSDSFTSVILDPYRSPTNHRLDRGPAVFDVRNAFKTNVIYNVPFRSASAPLRRILGGWSISAIAIAQSGEPFSILSGEINQLGQVTDQTAVATVGGSALAHVVSYNMTGKGPSMIQASSAASVFLVPPAGTPGTLQPRSFYGPSSFDLDLALQKRFHVTEHQTLDIRGIAVNAFNHPSFGFVSQYIGASGFGGTAYFNQAADQVLYNGSYEVYPARTVQISAIYHF